MARAVLLGNNTSDQTASFASSFRSFVEVFPTNTEGASTIVALMWLTRVNATARDSWQTSVGVNMSYWPDRSTPNEALYFNFSEPRIPAPYNLTQYFVLLHAFPDSGMRGLAFNAVDRYVRTAPLLARGRRRVLFFALFKRVSPCASLLCLTDMRQPSTSRVMTQW